MKKVIIIIFVILLVILAALGINKLFFSKDSLLGKAENTSQEYENDINNINNSVAITNQINNSEVNNVLSEGNNQVLNNVSKDNNQIKNNVQNTTNKSENTSKNTNKVESTNQNVTNKVENNVSNKNTNTQSSSKNETTTNAKPAETTTPDVNLGSGIFSNYYSKANQKLKTLTLDEKIGQLFLVRFPTNNSKEILKQYKFGGYLFFEKDFKGKTASQVKERIKELQKVANIPLLTAVDEEGGIVVRISSNPNLSKSRFKSPNALYTEGGFNKIKQDTINKSKLLSSLGINLNLAPVVDVSTSSSDYMYQRSLGKNTSLTSTYAKTVISASKGYNVSYTLKHFPGYGNNVDTHTGKAVDNRSYNQIVKNDLPPFTAGINAGAEAVLVSHNIVTSIDKSNPASLSKKVHNVLRNDLGFTGIIITDDLDMGAVSNDSNATVKAIKAGNDLIITTDYKSSISSVKQALKSGKISEKLVNEAACRILAWKYYKGLM